MFYRWKKVAQLHLASKKLNLYRKMIYQLILTLLNKIDNRINKLSGNLIN